MEKKWEGKKKVEGDEETALADIYPVNQVVQAKHYSIVLYAVHLRGSDQADYLSIYLSVDLLSTYLSVYLSIYTSDEVDI